MDIDLENKPDSVIEEDAEYYGGYEDGYRPVSIKGWIGIILLSCIPGVNLVMWIVSMHGHCSLGKGKNYLTQIVPVTHHHLRTQMGVSA